RARGSPHSAPRLSSQSCKSPHPNETTPSPAQTASAALPTANAVPCAVAYDRSASSTPPPISPAQYSPGDPPNELFPRPHQQPQPPTPLQSAPGRPAVLPRRDKAPSYPILRAIFFPPFRLAPYTSTHPRQTSSQTHCRNKSASSSYSPLYLADLQHRFTLDANLGVCSGRQLSRPSHPFNPYSPPIANSC